MLSNSTPLYTQDDETTYLAVFSKNNEKTSVIWQDPWMDTRKVKINGNGTIVVYSMYGEKLIEATNTVTLDELDKPLYIIGDISGYEYLSAPPIQHP